MIRGQGGVKPTNRCVTLVVYLADLLVLLSQEKFAPYDFTRGLELFFSDTS